MRAVVWAKHLAQTGCFAPSGENHRPRSLTAFPRARLPACLDRCGEIDYKAVAPTAAEGLLWEMFGAHSGAML